MKNRIIERINNIKNEVIRIKNTDRPRDTYEFLDNKFDELENIQSDIIKLYHNCFNEATDEFSNSKIYEAIKQLIDISEDAGARSYHEEYYTDNAFIDTCDRLIEYLNSCQSM